MDPYVLYYNIYYTIVHMDPYVILLVASVAQPISSVTQPFSSVAQPISHSSMGSVLTDSIKEYWLTGGGVGGMEVEWRVYII